MAAVKHTTNYYRRVLTDSVLHHKAIRMYFVKLKLYNFFIDFNVLVLFNSRTLLYILGYVCPPPPSFTLCDDTSTVLRQQSCVYSKRKSELPRHTAERSTAVALHTHRVHAKVCRVRAVQRLTVLRVAVRLPYGEINPGIVCREVGIVPGVERGRRQPQPS